MRFNKKIDGNEYANLVTVFAIIVAVEYSSGKYDQWDFLIGLVSVLLGLSFVKKSYENKDFFYTILTSSLISLGVVSIGSSIFSFIYLLSSEAILLADNYTLSSGFYRFSFFREKMDKMNQ